MKNFDRKACDKWDERELRERDYDTRRYFEKEPKAAKGKWRLAQKKRDEEIKQAAIHNSKEDRHQRTLTKAEKIAQEQREQAGIVFGEW